MTQIYYSVEHEWMAVDGDLATVGITRFAAQALGDLVYVELPQAGRTVAEREAVAVVESVKAASEVFAPRAGEIVAVNEALVTEPALGNRDPEGEGWFFKLRLATGPALDGLLDRAAYEALLEQSP